MQRPLAILAGLSCCLFVASFVASVVSIREPVSLGTTPRTPQEPLPPRLEPGLRPPPPERSPLAEALHQGSLELADRALEQALGPLAAALAESRVATSSLLLESPRRGIWVTETEIRVPCRDLDQSLRRLRSPELGTSRHCERWVEAMAEVLERRNLAMLDPREIVTTYGEDQAVRVLILYAGWRMDAAADTAAEPPALVHAQHAPALPLGQLGSTRRRALTEVYQALELGPYSVEG